MNPPSSQARLHGTRHQRKAWPAAWSPMKGSPRWTPSVERRLKPHKHPRARLLSNLRCRALRHDARRVPAAPTVLTPTSICETCTLTRRSRRSWRTGHPPCFMASSEGIGQVMDWTAEGHITLLDVAPLFGRRDAFARRWTTSHSSSKTTWAAGCCSSRTRAFWSCPRHRGRPRRRRRGRDRPP